MSRSKTGSHFLGRHFGLSYSSVSKAAGSLEKQMYEDKELQKEINGIISRFNRLLKNADYCHCERSEAISVFINQ